MAGRQPGLPGACCRARLVRFAFHMRYWLRDLPRQPERRARRDRAAIVADCKHPLPDDAGNGFRSRAVWKARLLECLAFAVEAGRDRRQEAPYLSSFLRRRWLPVAGKGRLECDRGFLDGPKRIRAVEKEAALTERGFGGCRGRLAWARRPWPLRAGCRVCRPKAVTVPAARAGSCRGSGSGGRG
jgi:hypothetical protein